MQSLLVQAKELVARAAAELDPATVTAATAVRLLDDVVAIERQLAALKLRLAHRAEASPEWSRQGFRSPDEWLARKQGVGVGQAARMFEAARRLEDLPSTSAALADGQISEVQAMEVAHGASADPDAEDRLLATAVRDGLVGVRKEAERVRAAALDDEARRERQHRNRHLRSRTGRDGAFDFYGSATADRGSQFWGSVRQEADRLFEAARKAGRRENSDAYMLDALLNLVLGDGCRRGTGEPAGAPADEIPGPAANTGRDGGGPAGDGERARRPKRTAPPRIDRTIFVRVDATSLSRGHTVPGEICEIVGAGPVPPSLVRSWCTDANLRLLFLEGTEVVRVVHLGRGATETQRTALYERAAFRCEVEGCSTAHGLEIDHVAEWTLTKRTVLDDLALLCSHHHRLKTSRRFRLLGPPGRRRLVPPNDDTATSADGPDPPFAAAQPA